MDAANEDEGEEEDRDEIMIFSKSRIEDVPTTKNLPQSCSMNIDLTGDFTSPITSYSSGTIMTYFSKGSENSIAIVGKLCNLAHLKIGEESESIVC